MKKIHALNTIYGGLNCNFIFEVTPDDLSDDFDSIVNISCLSCANIAPNIIKEALTESAEVCLATNQSFLLAIDVQDNRCAIYKYYY